MHQVFLSYCREDIQRATQIAAYLESNGVRVWRDTQDIRAGAAFDDVIREAIQRAGFFVVVVSKEWLSSSYCLLELRCALELRQRRLPITVVPLRIDGAPVPEVFGSMQMLELRGFEREDLQSVLSAIRSEHVAVMLDNRYLRITSMRQGDPFSSSDHPVSALVATARSSYLAVFLLNSVGERALATEATRQLRKAASLFAQQLPEIVSALAKQRPDEPIGAARLFQIFFSHINEFYQKAVLAALQDPGLVYSDVTMALLMAGKIHVKNAGCSGGLVRTFLGQEDHLQRWGFQALTGTIGGSLDLESDPFGGILGFPIGRYIQINETVTPLELPFQKPGSRALLTSFSLRKRDLDELYRTTLELDALATARHLLATSSQWRSLWHLSSDFAVIIECRGLDSQYMDVEDSTASSETAPSANREEARGDARAAEARRLLSENRVAEALAMLREAAALLKDEGRPTAGAAVLEEAGTVAFELGRHELAVEALSQAVAEYTLTKTPADEARSRHSLGIVHSARGNAQDALMQLTLALDKARETRDLDTETNVLSSRGAQLRRSGDLKGAIEDFTRALAITRDQQQPAIAGGLLNNLGMCYSRMGENDRALEYFEEAATRLEGTAHPSIYATALANCAWELHFKLGRSAEGASYALKARDVLRNANQRRTASGVGLPEIQSWLDEMSGTGMNDAQRALTARILSSVVQDPEEAAPMIGEHASLVFTDYAEALLEDASLAAVDFAASAAIRKGLDFLRLARERGLEVALRAHRQAGLDASKQAN